MCWLCDLRGLQVFGGWLGSGCGMLAVAGNGSLGGAIQDELLTFKLTNTSSFMKLLVLLFSLLLTLLGSHGGKDARPTGRPRRPAPYASAVAALPKLGRCSGDAYCRACSSCEYCGHCAGGGGTCGVCASSSPAKPVYSRSRSSARGSRSGARSYGGGRGSYVAPKTPATPLEVSGDYYITASTLNLRAEPSADAEVVRVLSRNDQVTVQELTNAKWAKVSVATEEGEVEGYVSRDYLSDTMSAE